MSEYCIFIDFSDLPQDGLFRAVYDDLCDGNKDLRPLYHWISFGQPDCDDFDWQRISTRYTRAVADAFELVRGMK